MAPLFSAYVVSRFIARCSLSGDGHTDEGQEIGCTDRSREMRTDTKGESVSGVAHPSAAGLHK